MASAKETLGQAAGKAVELGKKGYHLYLEMVDKVLDSVVGIARDQDNKGSALAVKVLDSTALRKAAPYAVLGAAVFDIAFLPIINRHKKD